MSAEDNFIHYVCTHKEASDIIDRQQKFFISNCGCREEKNNVCIHNKYDICLQFFPEATSETVLREIDIFEARELLAYAQEKFLVTRPFRNLENRDKIEGICFCCHDCCGYFTDPADNTCANGHLLEYSDLSNCNLCGLCVEVCYFGARKFTDGKLNLHQSRCAGCGLCQQVCPIDCILMVPR